MEPKHFTREQIDKLTRDIHSLDQKEREAVRAALRERMHVGDGKIGQEELHLELIKLRKANKISELDMKNVEDAIFGG